MSQPFDADVSIDAPEIDVPVDASDLDSDVNLGIDVATAPELEDAETRLGARGAAAGGRHPGHRRGAGHGHRATGLSGRRQAGS